MLHIGFKFWASKLFSWQLFGGQWFPQCWCPIRVSMWKRSSCYFGLVCQSSFREIGLRSTGTGMISEFWNEDGLLLEDELCAIRWVSCICPSGSGSTTLRGARERVGESVSLQSDEAKYLNTVFGDGYVQKIYIQCALQRWKEGTWWRWWGWNAIHFRQMGRFGC